MGQGRKGEARPGEGFLEKDRKKTRGGVWSKKSKLHHLLEMRRKMDPGWGGLMVPGKGPGAQTSRQLGGSNRGIHFQ